MANRYWIGGTGNWDAATTTNWSTTSGGAGGASVPTSADSVIFDTLSNAIGYTVTVTATANCLDLTIGAPLTGNLTFAGSSQINIYGSYSIAGSGVTLTATGQLNLLSTTSGRTITTNGVTLLSTILINNTGGWSFADAFTGTSILISNGTVNTNNFNITLSGAFSTGNGTVTLGTSTISLGGNFQASTGTTLSAASSTINQSGQTFTGAGKTYGAVTLTSVFSNFVTGGNTFASLTYNGPATTRGVISFDSSQTISGTLTLNGNSTTNRILISSATPGTNITLTAATVAITYADFMDITGAGAGSWNLSAITGLSGDCGGNSGITFTTPATQTANGTTSFSWSNAARWTSRIPLPQDNVIINNAFGTSQTITVDMPRIGKDVDLSGLTFTTALNFTISTTPGEAWLFGGLTMKTGVTTPGTQNLCFYGRGSHNVDVAGCTFYSPGFYATGAYTLTNNLQAGNGGLKLRAKGGSLTVGVYNITSSSSIDSTGSGAFTVNMGSGTWTSTATSGIIWSISGSIVFVPETSTIKMTGVSASSITFNGGGKTFNNLWWARGTSTGINIMQGSNTFNDFKDDGSVAHTIQFTTGTTQTVSTFTVLGSSGNIITIDSTTTGTHNLVKLGGGQISSDYLNIQHSVATPGSTWFAGTNSTNNQAVATAGSGWIFTAPTPPTSTNSNFFLFMS